MFGQKRSFKPPKCPCCRAKLDVVYENVYETYSFDSKTGTYKGPCICDLEIKCPDCNCKIADIFPNGACNYKTGERKKAKEQL